MASDGRREMRGWSGKGWDGAGRSGKIWYKIGEDGKDEQKKPPADVGFLTSAGGFLFVSPGDPLQ